ncbi:hypothetical protein HHK36_032619 [Tetracentron sinense]|uniref:Uncharacterized protein n=1 Tax=Tetracentron sinense TaxID=13715 RepID=A0A834Y4Q6_TETSI|nr:hypothetical protein HHK36_032619 [Tetracentron sinense]
MIKITHSRKIQLQPDENFYEHGGCNGGFGSRSTWHRLIIQRDYPRGAVETLSKQDIPYGTCEGETYAAKVSNRCESGGNKKLGEYLISILPAEMVRTVLVLQKLDIGGS